MELSTKEKIITLAALHAYMKSIENQLRSGELDEEAYSDLANDASLLEIVIARFEEAGNKQP